MKKIITYDDISNEISSNNIIYANSESLNNSMSQPTAFSEFFESSIIRIHTFDDLLKCICFIINSNNRLRSKIMNQGIFLRRHVSLNFKIMSHWLFPLLTTFIDNTDEFIHALVLIYSFRQSLNECRILSTDHMYILNYFHLLFYFQFSNETKYTINKLHSSEIKMHRIINDLNNLILKQSDIDNENSDITLRIRKIIS